MDKSDREKHILSSKNSKIKHKAEKFHTQRDAFKKNQREKRNKTSVKA